jgi:hypothetical protein
LSRLSSSFFPSAPGIPREISFSYKDIRNFWVVKFRVSVKLETVLKTGGGNELEEGEDVAFRGEGRFEDERVSIRHDL